MKRLVITVNDLGSVKQYVIETSSGTRATGATLASALSKLLPVSARATEDECLVLANVLAGIRDSGPTGQIHRGVQS